MDIRDKLEVKNFNGIGFNLGDSLVYFWDCLKWWLVNILEFINICEICVNMCIILLSFICICDEIEEKLMIFENI